MDNLIKQLNRAGKALAQAVEHAEKLAEEQILDLIAEEIHKRGYEENEIEQHFDLSRQTLKNSPEDGLLINEVYIVGERETKTVIAAYRLEVSYRPEGFDKKGLVMKVRGRVENVTGSFFYPEDDESIFH